MINAERTDGEASILSIAFTVQFGNLEGKSMNGMMSLSLAPLCTLGTLATRIVTFLPRLIHSWIILPNEPSMLAQSYAIILFASTQIVKSCFDALEYKFVARSFNGIGTANAPDADVLVDMVCPANQARSLCLVSFFSYRWEFLSTRHLTQAPLTWFSQWQVNECKSFLARSNVSLRMLMSSSSVE